MNIIKSNLKYDGKLTPLNPRDVLYIILHHPEAVIASPEDIHQWHLENGWAGAGYNYLVRKDGTVYEIRGNNVGAQCSGHNEKSIGICCEGNYDKETSMPQAQFNSTVELIKMLKPKYPNLQEIGGHQKYFKTSCPGRYFPLSNIINSANSVNPVEVAIKFWGSKAGIDVNFWLKHAVQGCQVSGDVVQALLIKTYNSVKGA